MNLIIFGLTSALLSSIGIVIEKKVLNRSHSMELSSSLALVNLLLSLPLFLFIDRTHLTFQSLALVYLVSLIASIAFLLTARSIRHMELSAASPLLSGGAGLSAVLAFFFLGERLSLAQIGGLVLAICGTYVLETERHQKLFDPFRKLFASKYARYIAISLSLYGISSLLDRMILSRYSLLPFEYIAIVHLFIAANFFVATHIFGGGIRSVVQEFKDVGWLIIPLALITVTQRIAYAETVRVAYLGIASAIKRLSGLFTTIIGGELFHESHLVRKTIAASIVVAGSILVVLS
ncbi:MAG: EamA family transporter [Patescibacteria group bacterium]